MFIQMFDYKTLQCLRLPKPYCSLMLEASEMCPFLLLKPAAHRGTRFDL